MTETQKKLKEYWEELLNETSHTARYGDHSSHNGYFNPENGCGDPPYTGEGLSATMDIQEWDEFMEDPLAMFDWDYYENMPELVKPAFNKWLEINHLATNYNVTGLLTSMVKHFVVQAFARDFFKVATGKDFEVVSL
jgi:hypothetical protein